MRLKSVDQFLLVLMFLTGSFSLFLLFSPENKQSNEVAIGLIVDQINIVKKKGQIFEAWNDVATGDSLKLNDQVYTHESSQVELLLKSGRKINVQENSLLKITEDLLGEKVELERGTINAVLNSKNSSLSLKIAGKNVLVKSENGTIQIEKTKDVSRIFVEKGNVQIDQAGNKKTVKENEILESDIKSGTLRIKTVSLKASLPKDQEKIILNELDQVKFQWSWLKNKFDLTKRFSLQVSTKKSFDEFEEFSIDESMSSFELKLPKEGSFFWRFKEEDLNNLGQVVDLTTGPIRRFEIVYEIPVIVDNVKNLLPLLPVQKNNILNLGWVDSVANRIGVNADFYLIKVQGPNGEKTYKTNTTQLNWAFDKIGTYHFQIKAHSKLRPKTNWSHPFVINVVENTIPKIESLTPSKVEYIDYSRAGMKALIRWKVLSGVGKYRVVVKSKNIDPVPDRVYETDSDFFNVDLLKPGIYEWSVISLDVLGNSGVEIKGSFHLKFPRKVTTLPSEGEIVLLETPDQEVQFKWEKQTNVKSYLFELSKDKDFKSIDINSELEKSQFTTKLNDVGQYYWRVKMNTQNGVEYSDPVSVEIKPVPVLDKPKLENEIRIKLKTIDESKVKDQVLNNRRPRSFFLTLVEVVFQSVKATSNDKSLQVAEWVVPTAKNVKKYLIEIYQDKDLKKLITKIESDSENIEWKGASAGEFYWRLAYRDGWGRDSEYSFPAKIIIDQGELSKVEKDVVVEAPEIKLISPKHREDFQADKMIFSWDLINLDTKKKKMTLLIAKDLEFNEIVFEKNISKNEVLLDCQDLQSLNGKESYYWRVKIDGELSKRRAISFSCLNKKVVAKEEVSVDKSFVQPNIVKNDPMIKVFFAPMLTEQTSQYSSKKIIVDGQNLFSVGGWKKFSLENFWSEAIEVEARFSTGKVFNSENYQKLSLTSGLLFSLGESDFSFLAGLNFSSQSTYEVVSSTVSEQKMTMVMGFGKMIYQSDLFSSAIALGFGNSIWIKAQISKVINTFELGVFFQQTNFESEGSSGQKIDTDENSMGIEFSYLFY